MIDALAVAGVILYFVTLWTGYRKIKMGSFPSALISMIELALTVISIIGLGWKLGLAVVGLTNLVAILATSVNLAIRNEDILAFAASQAGTTKKEMQALAKRLIRSGKVFKTLGPIRTAQLISFLSQRGRNIRDIEKMAPAIATLWVVHRMDLEPFVRDFDRLMRLWKKPPTESMHVADVLTVASQKSAATFDEMLQAMLGVADAFNSQTHRGPLEG